LAAPRVDEAMQVEIWSDVVCPWCYLGKRHFEQALEGFAHRADVAVTYRSFELDPGAPQGVTTPTAERLAAKYGMTAAQAHDAQRQMEQRAAQRGLTFRMDGLRSGNTRDAHRLLHLAKARGRQAELAERLHRAYFTEQASIFDAASLAGLAADAGLDRDEALAVLASDEYGQDVDTDERMAQSLGVTGVPFFVLGRRYAVSGAQPPEIMAEALERAWAETRAEAKAEAGNTAEAAEAGATGAGRPAEPGRR
jgi:predicted DsbA family dithiol-disulfide isomerase